MSEDKRIDEALSLLRAHAFKDSPDLSERIMAAIRLETEEASAPSNLFWLSVGAIILASLTILPFGKDFIWLLRAFDSALLLPISITLGGVLSVYAGLFIASNLDGLSRHFKLRHH